MASSLESDHNHDHLSEVKRFDDSKLGVKGLVDLGVTAIPRFFIHPPETLSDIKKPKPSRSRSESITTAVPTVDLSGRREAAVEEIRRACKELGFFQVVNHGISTEVMEKTLKAVKGFHEQETEIKAGFYTRKMGTGVSFISNVDLYNSKAASWRDTLQVRLGPAPPNPEDLPEICRNEIIEWDQHIQRLGEVLMGLLCDGLGLPTDRLKQMTCLEARVMVGHYYPPCPQPDLTVGITSHTDPGILTVLMQDQVGGLQIKHGEEWVDVKPVPGALVINVADALQIMSNDEYKSVDHRVLANPHDNPRVSVAVFFSPGNRDILYGPFPELISSESPALFRQFDYNDYIMRFFKKDLGDKRLIDHYRA